MSHETFKDINVDSEIRPGADVTILPHNKDLTFSDRDETQTVHLHNRIHYTHTNPHKIIK